MSIFLEVRERELGSAIFWPAADRNVRWRDVGLMLTGCRMSAGGGFGGDTRGGVRGADFCRQSSCVLWHRAVQRRLTKIEGLVAISVGAQPVDFAQVLLKIGGADSIDVFWDPARAGRWSRVLAENDAIAVGICVNLPN